LIWSSSYLQNSELSISANREFDGEEYDEEELGEAVAQLTL
jgi:hypothetical protein